jgi:hypothetical protein
VSVTLSLLDRVRWSRAAFGLLPLALVAAAVSSPAWAEDANPTPERRTLAESTGDVPRTCTSPNCATVIAVKQADFYESPPLFGPYRITPQSRFQVQKHKEVWVVEVRRQDGTVQAVKLNYPALFQVGDWVLVEGDQIRAPE